MPVFNNALAGAAGSGGADAGYKIERSLRFNQPDSAHLDRAFSSSANRKKYTISFWIKRNKLSSGQRIYSTNTNSYLMLDVSDYLHGNTRGTSGTNAFWYTDQQFRDTSAWYHIVAVYDIGVGAGLEIYVNGIKVGINGTIANNDQHDGGTHTIGGPNYMLDAYLAEYHHLDGIKINGTTDTDGSVTGTVGAVYLTDFGEFDDNGIWQPKAYSGSHGTHGYYLDFKDTSSDDALGYDAAGSNNWTVSNLLAQGSAADPFTVLGNQSNSGSSSTINVSSLTTITSTPATSWPPDSNTYNHLTADFQSVGNYSIHADPFLSDPSANITVYQSDNGTSWTSISKGQSPYSFSGRYIQWVRAGSGYGAQTLRSPSTFKDQDSLFDSPTNYDDGTNVGGNYCTFNTLRNGATLSNGNLDVSSSSNGVNSFGTFGVSSGKWYWEVTINAKVNYYYPGIGVNTDLSQPNNEQSGGANDPDGYMYLADGQTFNNDNTSSYGSSYDVGDVIGVALDMDAGTITFYKNGDSQGQAFSSITGTAVPVVISYTGSACSANFGQRPFAISSVPTGFKSLCTQNLDPPLVGDGSDYFDVALYTGNGTTGQSITGLEFSPDLVWIKERNNSGGHSLVDTVRGPTKPLMLNTNDEYSKTEFFDSFDSNGFTVDYNGVDSSLVTNRNLKTYAAWAWDGGDLVTNSTYNQGEVWSSKLSAYANSLGSEPVTNLFDGDTSTSFYSNSTSGSGIKFVPTTAITGSIELYLRNGDTANSTFSYSLDNGSTFTDLTTTAGNGSYVSIGNQTITNTNGIIVRHVTTAGTNSVNWRAIKVDNKVLVDAGVIPIGSLNDAAYNSTRQWSGDWSTNVYYSTYNASKVFDGNQSTNVAVTYPSTSTTINVNPAISGSVIRVLYARDSGAVASINGSETLPATTNSATYVWHTLTATSITSITLAHDNGGSSYIRAIEVDGKILLDQGVTPVDDFPSIVSTVRANPTAGFSIVSFTGTGGAQTTGHGLNATPGLVLLKNRDSTNTHWQVFGDGYERLQLTTTQKELSGDYTLERTLTTISPTQNSVSELQINQNGDNFIAYCFAPVEGYSAMGMYIGNYSSDGPFVYTGFRPAFLMWKNITNDGFNWGIIDSARGPYNYLSRTLNPNVSNSESTRSTADAFDFLSNGFKVRASGSNARNQLGSTFMWFAVAESPFKYSRAR